MLTVLPAILLIAAAAVIIFLQRYRPGFGISWLLGVGISLATWGLLVFYRWRLPSPFTISGWQPGTGLSFRMDAVSWPYSLALAGVALAVLLTAGARLGQQSNPSDWAGSLLVTGFGILTVQSGTLLTLLVIWTAVDVIELVILLGRFTWKESSVSQIITAFAMRVLGSMIALWAMLFSVAHGGGADLSQISTEAGIFVLLAAGLRLGVLPLYLPFTEELPMGRGLGVTLRMTAAASSLVLLARLPATVVTPNWAPVFLGFAALAALYGAGMWLAARNELVGRPYWTISLAGMAIGSVIRGHPEASPAWGIVLILSGCLLFLYSSQQRRSWILPAISLAALSGLPFTPAASGWSGLIVPPVNLLDFVYLLAHVMLLLGFLRHALRQRDTIDQAERWIQAAYTVGLFFLLATQVLIGLWGWTGSLTAGVWWASLVSALLTGLSVVIYFRFGHYFRDAELGTRWFSVLARQVGKRIADFLSLNWLYGSIRFLYSSGLVVINALTLILEGDGGLLWVFVLLALMVSILQSGGQP
jgi:hypothetical protein